LAPKNQSDTPNININQTNQLTRDPELRNKKSTPSILYDLKYNFKRQFLPTQYTRGKVYFYSIIARERNIPEPEANAGIK